MNRLILDGNALEGKVGIDYPKAIKNITFLLLGGYGLIFFNDPGALIITMVLGLGTMYFGVVAYHRLLIHRSFTCPKEIEYILVFLANFAGMGGPISLIKIHDFRDWAQRQKECHPYFNHKRNILIDGVWILFCKLELKQPPLFKIEIDKDPFYMHLEKYGLLYQIPLAVLIGLLGNPAWILTTIFLRLFSVQCGHWLIAHFLHNYGKQPKIMPKAGTQGYNLPFLAFFTFGEAYHNNHHHFPDAASNKFREGEIDPAWWLIWTLAKLKLADKVKIFQNGQLQTKY